MKGRFLENVLLQAVPGAAAVMLCATVAMLMELVGYDLGMCTTLATLSAGIMGLIVLGSVCMPLTPLRLGLLLTMCAGFAAAVGFAGHVFFLDVASMALENWLLLGVFMAGAAAVLLLTARLMRRRIRHAAAKAA